MHESKQILVLLPEVGAQRLLSISGRMQGVGSFVFDLWCLLSEHFTSVRHVHFSDGGIANHCNFVEDIGDVFVVGAPTLLTGGVDGNGIERSNMWMKHVVADLELEMSAFMPGTQQVCRSRCALQRGRSESGD